MLDWNMSVWNTEKTTRRIFFFDYFAGLFKHYNLKHWFNSEQLFYENDIKMNK